MRRKAMTDLVLTSNGQKDLSSASLDILFIVSPQGKGHLQQGFPPAEG